jgi:nucleoside-diphosphate-sugar epimerase
LLKGHSQLGLAFFILHVFNSREKHINRAFLVNCFNQLLIPMGNIDKNKPVLVTGVSGYIASWVAKYLVDEGYLVHGTVRSLSDPEKVAHLRKIDQEGSGTLKLFEADLLQPNSFKDAMRGCELVIHIASPFLAQHIKDPENQLIKPALEGTKNVLGTVNKTETVKRVVVTSSVVAIYGDAIDISETKEGIFTEEHWNTTSSAEHQPYSYSKTLAEREAWKMAGQQNRWNLVVINPGFVMGPSLSKRIDATSIDFMRSMVNGKYRTGVPDLYFAFVDVRDVARAHINAGFIAKASGRHILVNDVKNVLDMADMLREKYDKKYKIPKYTLPNFLLYLAGPFQGFTWKYLKRNLGISYKFENAYSKTDLAIEYRQLSETFADHVAQLEQDGLI